MVTSFLRRLRRPIGPVPTYLLLRGSSDFLFTLIFTLNLVYQATVVGLSPMQLVLVGTLLETISFLFEMPTGIVADVYSRRLSILIGLFLVGAGFTIEGTVAEFLAVLLCQVFWGIGATFLSGAVEAWITDEVGDHRVGSVFLRGTQVGMIGTMLGIGGAVALGWESVQVPVLVGGLGFMVLGVILAMIMPEHGFIRRFPVMVAAWRTWPECSGRAYHLPAHVRLLGGCSRSAWWSGSQARHLTDYGRCTYSRTWTDRQWFTNVALWFRAIHSAGTILGLGATELARRLRPESLAAGAPVRMLMAMASVKLLATIGFAFSPVLWIALPLLWSRGVAETVAGLIEAAWMNRNLEPRVRATVLSMESQLNAVGQIAGGPPLGAIGSRVSVVGALIGSALVYAPVLWIYGRLTPARVVMVREQEVT